MLVNSSVSPVILKSCKIYEINFKKVTIKAIYILSFMGTKGTFSLKYKNIINDYEFLYNMLYFVICLLGLIVHESFYGLLVSITLWFTIV